MKCTKSAVISVLILILFSSRRVSCTVNYKTWSVTQFEDLVLRHTWTIHDCDTITLLNQTIPIVSPDFWPTDYVRFVWSLQLHLQNSPDSSYMTIYLKHRSLDTVKVNYTLSIASVKYEDSKTFNGYDQWGTSNSFRRDEVFKSCQPIGSLNINCEIRVIHKIDEISSLTTPHGHSFSKTAQFSDVIIVVGRNEIRADKNILVARSPVFASLLLKNGISNNYGDSSIIRINDVEPEVFVMLLRYIYTNKVDGIDDTMAKELSVAAIKYGLEDLKVICDNILRDKKLQENNKLIAKRVPLAIQSTANVVPT